MKTKEPNGAEEHCGTCRYYQEYEEQEELETDDVENPENLTGICRRYPPIVFPGLTPTSTYPDVSGPTGWCGEYMPRS